MGTPTMGGIVIIGTVALITILLISGTDFSD
jgi:UDP-N-acetylmuramyl pentapeptide phosphotransferase/UDP-N-acetylglucosamine-1-phosphate transferase